VHVAIGWWISCCCIEPWNPIHICKEIDGNISCATSPTRELTLIKICSKLLDANLSQGRISPLDSLHLCQNDELCSDTQRWDNYQTANTSPVSYVIDNNGSWGAHFSICLSKIEKNSEAVAISHQVTCKTGPFLHCCFTYCKQIWLGRITFTAKLL